MQGTRVRSLVRELRSSSCTAQLNKTLKFFKRCCLPAWGGARKRGDEMEKAKWGPCDIAATHIPNSLGKHHSVQWVNTGYKQKGKRRGRLGRKRRRRRKGWEGGRRRGEGEGREKGKGREGGGKGREGGGKGRKWTFAISGSVCKVSGIRAWISLGSYYPAYRWVFRSVHVSVQFSSVTQSCPTLCNPMNRSMPGLPVHHQLPEFTQTHVHRVSDAIQPSHPLASPSPPAPNPSQHQSLFQWVSSSHEVAKELEFQL